VQARPDEVKEPFIRATAFRRFAKALEIADAILCFTRHHRTRAERLRRLTFAG